MDSHIPFVDGPFSDDAVQDRAREYDLAVRELKAHAPMVGVLGSARTQPGHPHWALVAGVAAAVARAGHPILTGGGGGFMLAAGQGARAAGGFNAGLNILLPWERKPQPHLDQTAQFASFSLRKMAFVRLCGAYVFAPGGLGTLDELMEFLVLMQNRKIARVPVVLLGSSFWNGLLEWMRTTVVADGLMGAADLELVRVVDTVEDAMAALALPARAPG